MLSQEQRFFLSVLADHLNGRETAPVAELDWGAVYDMAAKHQLSALVYAQCGAFLPPEAELPFLQDYGAAVADHAARQKIAAEIDRAFTLRKIPYVLVKGLIVAECYPQPELRTMGDIDIVVKAEDKEKAHDILSEQGFEIQSKGADEWIYRKENCEIELHHRLLYDNSLVFASSLQLTDQMWEHVRPLPGSCRRELEEEFHFLFLATHLQKHLAYDGAGFRQFMDLAVAAQTWSLNWQKLNRYLEEMGSRSFVEVALTLCRRWFQLTLPGIDRKLSPEFEQNFCQQLFCNGTFGFFNEDSKDNLFVNKVNAAGDDNIGGRLRILGDELKRLPSGKQGLWRVLFPSYDDLRKREVYRFVDHRPWLLPVAWLYRVFHCFWFKVTRSYFILRFSRKAVQERNETLKKLGMLKQFEKR